MSGSASSRLGKTRRVPIRSCKQQADDDCTDQWRKVHTLFAFVGFLNISRVDPKRGWSRPAKIQPTIGGNGANARKLVVWCVLGAPLVSWLGTTQHTSQARTLPVHQTIGFGGEGKVPRMNGIATCASLGVGRLSSRVSSACAAAHYPAQARFPPGSSGASTGGDVSGEAGGSLREANTWAFLLSRGQSGTQVEAAGGSKKDVNGGRRCPRRQHLSRRHVPRSHQRCPKMWWRSFIAWPRSPQPSTALLQKARWTSTCRLPSSNLTA